MSTTAPYQFGDVVDGHRWTVAGWERIEPPTEPEPVVAEPVVPEQSAARTVVVADDLRIELDESDADGGAPVASSTDHELDVAPEVVDDAFASVVALARVGQAHDGAEDRAWADSAREPIDEWTGWQPEPEPVIVLPAEPAVVQVGEQRHAPASRPVVVVDPPAAGWYPGRTPS